MRCLLLAEAVEKLRRFAHPLELCEKFYLFYFMGPNFICRNTHGAAPDAAVIGAEIVFQQPRLHPEVRAVAMEVRFKAASGHLAALCLLCPALQTSYRVNVDGRS